MQQVFQFYYQLRIFIAGYNFEKPWVILMPKIKLWFDEDNTSYKGSILNDLMAQYGLTQIIHEPTLILESSVSCVDLVFTSQENLFTN